MTDISIPISSVVIFGSGNVATHLAKAFSSNGISIRQIYSRNYQHARALASQFNETKAIEHPQQADTGADLWLIAVVDDAIKEIVSALPPFNGIVTHTAGSISMDVLSRFPHHGVFYPFQTLSKERKIDYNSLPLLIEGSDNVTTQKLLKLARTVSPIVSEADSGTRGILHIAAVFSCNFVNHLYTLSADLLANNGLSFDFLTPLIQETTRKILTMPPQKAQTGPAIRNDKTVMNKHLEQLKDNPTLKKIYQLMSENIIHYHQAQ
ncbi:Rossmann-like and DUF2520 domain-containing protein [Thermophagus xiamenensis]|uniref:Predicted oxidoreductase, contains short-chain dehydrogenase (SDR) and DUF2520 domains n=1 Tax=Thermophagus xiamenensis TaxID=385682 RepID=A0A1I1W0X5_9BACT|nr:Rossmann-like and DUF2520 domain-containing protein [Thermophagus xiamenensis]SFD86560.1 Predicted oxidoreductase, contains short-chain dehydrogenase (SDR) and DUF2520 domains [Thermophagus xiamenensis]